MAGIQLNRPFEDYGARLAAIFLLAIYPGFYLYQSLAGLGYTGLFMGGWASWCNLAGAAVLVPILIYSSRRSQNLWVHAPFGVIVAIPAVYAIYYFVRGDHPWQRDPSLFMETGKLLLGWACLYAIGYFLTAGKRFRLAQWVAFLIMAGIAIIWMDRDKLSFVVQGRSTAASGVSDYQGFATAFLMVSVLALALTKKTRGYFAVLTIATAVIFLLSSRSELVAFIAVVAGWFVVQILHRRYVVATTGGALFLIVLGALTFYPAIATVFKSAPTEIADDGTREPIPSATVPEPKAPTGNVRQREVLNVTETASFNERLSVLETGIKGIKASPIVGDYGGQIRDHGKFGMYIHNGLSAWQQYGILTFVLYFGLTIFAFFVSIREVLWRRSTDRLWLASAFISGVALALIILTKSVFWPVPALAWGLLASRLSRPAKMIGSHGER